MNFRQPIAWGAFPRSARLGITKPYDGKPATDPCWQTCRRSRRCTVVNGVVVAIVADSKDKVDRSYRKALEFAGKDEGPAGPRGERFCAGYFRYLDRNKRNAFVIG